MGVDKLNINQMPVEVIAYLFEIYVCIAGTHQQRSKGALHLGAVCRTWRNIAWKAPPLWTSLCFQVENDTTEWQV